MTQQNKWATQQQLETKPTNEIDVKVVVVDDDVDVSQDLIIDNIVVSSTTEEIDPLTNINSVVTEPILPKKSNNKKNKEA